MVLTPRQKLDLLYQGQSKPAPADTGYAQEGIMEETDFTSEASPRHKMTEKSLLPSPGPSPNTIEETDHDEGSEIDDEYLAACAATLSKPSNIINSRRTGGHQKGNSIQELASGHDVSASTLSTNSERTNKCIPKISWEDESGHPLVSEFCTLDLVVVFPYKFIEIASSDRVAKRFFDGGKIWQYGWQIHYIYPPTSIDNKPLLLVPLSQFEDLINRINDYYKGSLVIPTDPNIGLLIPFYDDGTPQPTSLGLGWDRDHIREMAANVPAPKRGYGETPAGADPQLDRSFAAFRKKMELAAEATKRKNQTIEKKRAQDRIVQQREWCRDLKRAQRYLGLRPRVTESEDLSLLLGQDLSWTKHQQVELEYASATGRVIHALNIQKPTPYSPDEHPVIISFDVECNERNQHQITEIGVSTLDTLDLEGMAPGEGGCNWMTQIRSRHFRIAERMYIVNRDFCPGNPDAFLFGQSEKVTITNVGAEFDKCFQWPFSANYKHAGNWNLSVIPKTTVERGLKGLHIGNPIKRTAPTNTDSAVTSKEATNAVSGSRQGAQRHKVNVDDGRLRHSNHSLRATTAKHLMASTNQKGPMNRKIVLVGHDLASDIRYVRLVSSMILDQDGVGPNGESIYSTILEGLDTTTMYKVLARENQNRSLGHLLVELGITGWELHNAGNDARYTLEAFIAIAIQDRLNEDQRKLTISEKKGASDTAWQTEVQKRVDEKRQEAEDQVRSDAATWEITCGERNPDNQAPESDNNSLRTIETSSSFWLLDTDPIFQQDDDIDGGAPKGWNVEPYQEETSKPRRSKKSAAVKRREEEEWFNDYMKEQRAKQNGVGVKEAPRKGSGMH